MIYVIVRSYGDYSSYTTENVFASTSLDKAQEKLVLLENENELLKRANEEYNDRVSCFFESLKKKYKRSSPEELNAKK